jgi:hypothetical protein
MSSELIATAILIFAAEISNTHSRFGWVSEAGHVTRFCAGKILDY